MKKKRNFYIRLGNGCKEPVEGIYEYECFTARNGRQRFIFHKLPYLGCYAISDSHTGTSVIRGLNKMSKNNFIRICDFILRVTDVKKHQEEFPRVSKLKLDEE